MQIMQTISTSKEQIIKEQRNISKCAGLLCGRLLLLFGLFLLIVPLSPVAAYLFAFFLLTPWLLSNILENRKTPVPVSLNSCAEKYHYSSIHLSVEQNIGRIAILLLAAWQFYIPDSIAIYLYLAPGSLLMLYLLCRIISTMIIRHSIHSYYMELRSLQ